MTRPKKQSQKFSPDKLWEAVILSAHTVTPDTVPPGWYTTAQLAKMTGLSRVHVQHALLKLRTDHTIEVRKFRVISDRGFSMCVMHHKLGTNILTRIKRIRSIHH